MITQQVLARCPDFEPVDKRVPVEVWERIFNRLYPSQLSRLSMVNKTFNKIVSSLSVWSRMFTLAFGPKKRLRTLRNIDESKSYMLYMCASPVPTLSTVEFKYLGEEINMNWYLRMCASCREKQRLVVGNNEITNKRVEWYRTQP
ncbi:hypothetical protein EDD11_003065 [Mortierella claussenii]|nr:hypothetical protein EDD11_003065 [Mortierella claussenii]